MIFLEQINKVSKKKIYIYIYIYINVYNFYKYLGYIL